MKHIEVVAAVIINQGKILCVQRNEHKYDYISRKYEFPGGKIDEGETKEEALLREIREELKMNIKIESDFHTVLHAYPDFIITMYSFICTTESIELTRTEHINHLWLTTKELSVLDWAAADLPIVNKLIKG